MESTLMDLKRALRMVWQNPGFTFAVVTTLALGIGANTAIFSVVNSVLLKPVPFPDPDRLVMFMTTGPDGASPGGSPAKFQHWREQTSVVQQVAAFNTGVVNLTGTGFPEQLRSARVSADYFRLFGARVERGRSFSPEEDLPNAEKVVVVSHGLWTRLFAQDPEIIGKTISLSSIPHVVVGILAASFEHEEFGQPPEVYIPFQIDPRTSDQGHYFRVAGRLVPGATLEQAQARLKVSAEDYRRKFPDILGESIGFSVEPYRDVIVSNVRSSLLILVGAVSFVLLIACANVANLLLVRAIGRRREFAVRAAIGAGRRRIIRQLLTESFVLSLVGGGLGLALGVVGIRALLAVSTADLPRVGQDGSLVGVDWRVLAFTVIVSMGAALLFGLIPAWQASRADLGETLKESGGRSDSGFRLNKARSLLVVSEVALALVLLVGAALLIRTSIALGAVDPGFDTTNVLTMRMSLTGPRFLKSEGVEQLIRDGVERIEAVPGVVAASASCCVPLQGGFGLPFVIAGRDLEGRAHGGAGWATVSPGYFEVFQIPIKRGRAFTVRDDSQSPAVVLINESMAREHWPDENPLHDRLIVGRGVMKEFSEEPERQIIGVVGDVRDGGLNRDPGPKVYIPQAQLPDAVNALNVRIFPVAWVIRTQTRPLAVSSAVQEELGTASGLPVSNVLAMSEVASNSTARHRFNMQLMMIFGCSALLLAAIGIYGLMAYSVEQRTQEIGIRLALGAQAREVRNMVVLQGMRVALAGVVVGIAASLGLARFIESLLFGVEAGDTLALVVIPVALGVVALVAVWLPARRASCVDPIDALRY